MLRSFLIASLPDAKNLQNTFLYKYSSNVTTLTSCHFYHMLIYLRIVMPLGKKVFLLTRSRLCRNGLFFLDPKYVLIANNPAIVPRSFVRPPKNVAHISFFLKVDSKKKYFVK